MTTTVLAGASAPAAGLGIEPGIYPNLPMEAYHGDRGSLSSSGARKLLPPSCPALFRYEQDHPQLPKKAFDVGNAAHKLVLGEGPNLVRIDASEWRTAAVKAVVADVRAAGGVPLKPAEYDQVQAMADAIRRHPVASVLFAPESGRPEVSMFWTDGPTGITRRARFDWLPHPRSGRLIIPDYKTCRSAEPSALARAVDEYGYHCQDDWYRAAARAAGLAEDPAMVFVCQEKTAPYLVTVIELDAAARRIGAAKNRRAIDVFARCTETGYWPGYSDDITYLSLPVWAERRDEEEYL
ncbi:PD-(D/E)XK nuclease-like domain-containing protein [Streptomyces sp. NBC_01591]|uniref:PD-(D/E)XK nuclease-like domain-containing protein n=1 Tax=Streptomyces sp. NBC_01591 TaxID=2975888 RepID=UPI002DDC788B|nr:PD-(D/E)XK nuclease-like domain-containing protein [Streptomyces sp. NBC_01591]WSD71672.1 PD-(D/E)XK nuclease-like domain-containing protein [Streptomyces sp. NBC_01591]